MPSRLQVFVSDHCWGCREAKAIAREVRARFPGLTVQVIDVDDEASEKPPQVIAVPTYLWDGQVLCLGNPERGWLYQYLAEVLNQPASQ
ncbi:MAG: hypothetical protein ACE5MB_06705 [Anaerolineae bacterium]